MVLTGLAKAIRPTKKVPFPLWLPQNIVLVDGEQKGRMWSAQDAPYLVEPAECLDLSHPCNMVTIEKSQQTGASILAMAWALYIADQAPDNILYGIPGKDLLRDLNSLKLQPLIDEWQRETNKQVIAPTISRSGEGSKTFEKKFAGGSLLLANANTKNDVSGNTSRYGVKDELSKWEMMPDGSDPETLFMGRFTAFRGRKLYKILEISTPEIDSGDDTRSDPTHCRINRSFHAGDQRYWHIKCPECDYEQVQGDHGLLIDYDHPHKSAYLCENCGHHISELERKAAVRQGRYIANHPDDPSRHPSFHIDAFISLMLSYESISEDRIKAESGGEKGQKDYHNLNLGLPYLMKGDAPDYKRLMERREDYQRRIIPEAGLILVAGADVQHNGLYVEVVAFAQDRQSWCVDAQFFEGKTDDHKSGAWLLLDEFYTREFKDVYGNPRRLFGLAVDGGDGGRTNQVLEWTKRRPKCFAIKGRGGFHIPAMSPPAKTDIRKTGKRKRHGSAMLWPVGTWDLRREFYANLHRLGAASGEAVDPSGYCHFGNWLGEEYFKQITALYWVDTIKKGKRIQEWANLRKDDHFFDCRVYAMALAEHFGLSEMTPNQWQELRNTLMPNRVDLLSSDSERIAAGISPETPSVMPSKTQNKPDKQRRDDDKSNSPPQQNGWSNRRRLL